MAATVLNGGDRLGRILPGGVEVKRRDWCGVGTEETIRCQGRRVRAPCTYQLRGGYRSVVRGEQSVLKYRQQPAGYKRSEDSPSKSKLHTEKERG